MHAFVAKNSPRSFTNFRCPVPQFFYFLPPHSSWEIIVFASCVRSNISALVRTLFVVSSFLLLVYICDKNFGGSTSYHVIRSRTEKRLNLCAKISRCFRIDEKLTCESCYKLHITIKSILGKVSNKIIKTSCLYFNFPYASKPYTELVTKGLIIDKLNFVV